MSDKIITSPDLNDGGKLYPAGLPGGSGIMPEQKAESPKHSGVMVALMLTKKAAEALAIEGGEPADTLHLTLAYLGKLDGLPADAEARVARAAGRATTGGPLITGKVSGFGRFCTSELSDSEDVLYASFDAPALAVLREKLVEALKAEGVPAGKLHGFTPHITLGYIPSDEPTPELKLPEMRLTFRSIVLVAGDKLRARFRLTKRQSAASIMVEAGPPNEWSGGVAGCLGKEGRLRVKTLWEALAPEDRKRMRAAFAANFKADDVREDIEERYGEVAKHILIPVLKLVGSPRNKYGTHAGSHGFKGDYEQAWRLHFSQVGGGSLTVAAGGPLRGTVRRVSMIAAGMKPPCVLPSGENVKPRSGPKSPLPGSYPETPKDYGLTQWAKPSEDDLTQEDLVFTCQDLATIKRTALAEVHRRAKDREREEEEAAVKADTPVQKPFPNEHAARQTDPGKYDRFARKPLPGVEGIDAIYGLLGDGKSEIQSLRAKADKWTVAEFRDWLKAHDFKTTIEEATEKRDRFELTTRIIKRDEEKGIITGVVLEPEVTDAQGDKESREVIARAAYSFLSRFGRPGGTRLGVMHKQFGDIGWELIESWVQRDATTIGGERVKAGTWLMSWRRTDDDKGQAAWARVKRGELNGFSIGGVASTT